MMLAACAACSSTRWEVRETPFLAVDDGWDIPQINTSEDIPLQNLGDDVQAYMHFMDENQDLAAKTLMPEVEDSGVT